MQQLSNCPKCGKLFIRIRNICPDCVQLEEEDYRKVADYIRRNRGCTLHELSEQTHVSVSLIRSFILSGRIILTDLPNLEYPCDSCGAMIKRGKVCDKCKDTINQLINEADKRFTNEKKETRPSYKSHM